MIGGRHRPLKLISFQNKMHFLGFLFFTLMVCLSTVSSSCRRVKPRLPHTLVRLIVNCPTADLELRRAVSTGWRRDIVESSSGLHSLELGGEGDGGDTSMSILSCGRLSLILSSSTLLSSSKLSCIKGGELPWYKESMVLLGKGGL